MHRTHVRHLHAELLMCVRETDVPPQRCQLTTPFRGSRCIWSERTPRVPLVQSTRIISCLTFKACPRNMSKQLSPSRETCFCLAPTKRLQPRRISPIPSPRLALVRLLRCGQTKHKMEHAQTAPSSFRDLHKGSDLPS